MSGNRIIVLVWAERLDDSADFAGRIGAPFYAVYCRPFNSDFPLLLPIRYFLQFMKTWKILVQEKPTCIEVTNPPIFAVFTVYLYCELYRSKYVLCIHPPSLYSRKWGWTVPLLRYFARHALVNIIDQKRFIALLESWGARVMMLTKMPRTFSPSKIPPNSDGKYTITVVNTFAPDEPLDPIILAAERLPDVHFYVLGNHNLVDHEKISSAPSNVVFTGWLSHDLYWDQLRRSQAVMTLTTYPHSLLAGGTDGMAVGRPIILSCQPALTEYFTKGTIFVENTQEGIVDGIRRLQRDENRLQQEIMELATEKRQEWETNFQKLMNIIESPTSEIPFPGV